MQLSWVSHVRLALSDPQVAFAYHFFSLASCLRRPDFLAPAGWQSCACVATRRRRSLPGDRATEREVALGGRRWVVEGLGSVYCLLQAGMLSATAHLQRSSELSGGEPLHYSERKRYRAPGGGVRACGDWVLEAGGSEAPGRGQRRRSGIMLRARTPAGGACGSSG